MAEDVMDSVFRRIYAEYGGMMKKVGVSVLDDWHLAEDAIQEAMLRMFKVMMRGETITHLHSYAYRATLNAAIDLARRRGYKSEYEVISSDPAKYHRQQARTPSGRNRQSGPSEPSAESAAVQQISADVLTKRVRLSSGNQQNLDLIEAKASGMTDPQIATALGISERAAKSRLHRLRERLRVRLEGEVSA